MRLRRGRQGDKGGHDDGRDETDPARPTPRNTKGSFHDVSQTVSSTQPPSITEAPVALRGWSERP